jgi:tetratricopeptide (TPR) repeat protein
MSRKIHVDLLAFFGVLLTAALSSTVARSQISKEWGQCLASEGPHPDPIIAGCTAVIQANRDTPQRLATAHNNRAVAFKAKGEFDRALQDYDESIHLNPDVPNVYNNRGVIYRIKGDYARAVQEYGKAIALKGDYMAAFFNRAMALSDMGQFESALADFNLVLRMNPFSEFALYGRGLLKQKMRDEPGAAADMAAARATNPNIAGEFERPSTK